MGLTSSLKKLNLDLGDLEEVLSNHSIAAVTDAEGNIVYVNKTFCDISKYSQDELIGQNHRILKSDEHSDEFFTELWNTISSGKVWDGEIKNIAKDGSYYWLKSTIVPVFDSEKNIKNYVAIRTDITKEKEIHSKLLEMEDMLVKKNEDLLWNIQIFMGLQ